MTWLLVTTSPPELMIIPVPWSSWVAPLCGRPKLPWDVGCGVLASMDTTAGSTLAMTDSILVVPLSKAGPAEICFTLDPPTTEPSNAATTATTAHRQPPDVVLVTGGASGGLAVPHTGAVPGIT